MGRTVVRTGVALVWSAGLLLGVLAGPAAAKDAIGVFGPAVAEIFNNGGTCNRDGTVDPAGLGGVAAMELKDVNKATGTPMPLKDRRYHVVGPVLQMAADGINAGTLEACGDITKAFGIGPRCGMSKGYNGKGKIEWDDPATKQGGDAKLDNLVWKFSAAGTLPITARVTEWDAKSKPGRLLALAQAQGGFDCFANQWNPTRQSSADKPKDAGANRFEIFAVFVVQQAASAAEWNTIADPIDQKNDGQSTLLNPWGDKKNDKDPKAP